MRLVRALVFCAAQTSLFARLPTACALAIAGPVQHEPGADHAVPPSSSDDQFRDLGYRIEHGRAYWEIVIPSPIDREQLARYSSLLALSDAQRMQLTNLWEHYRERDWAFRMEHVQPLVDRSGDIAETRDLRAFRDLVVDRTRTVQDLEPQEQRLFTALKPFLTDAQKQLLPRLSDARIRARWLEFIRGCPGANLDLSIELWHLAQGGRDLGQPNEELEAALLQYERELTQLVQTAIDLRVSNMLDGGAIRLDMQELVEAADAEARASGSFDEPAFIDRFRSLRWEKDQLNARRYQAYERIQKLNLEYVERLASLLPSDTGALLREWFMETAHPVVYPDPFDAQIVIDATLALEDLGADQRATIEAVADAYEQRRDRLGIAMARAYRQWHKTEGSSDGFNEDRYIEYRDRMRTLQMQRQSNSREATNVLRSLLSSGQLSAIQSALKTYEDTAAAFDLSRSRLDSPRYDWPGRHD